MCVGYVYTLAGAEVKSLVLCSRLLSEVDAFLLLSSLTAALHLTQNCDLSLS